MFEMVLGLHNLARWLVLAAGLWAVIVIWRGWLGRRPWTAREMTAARIYVGLLDLQMLLGLLLYAVFSPLTHDAFRHVGVAMGDPSARYFVVEHPAIMVIAIAVAHVGVARAKRQDTDAAKYQVAAIWLGISLAAIAGFIPWARPLVPAF